MNNKIKHTRPSRV